MIPGIDEIIAGLLSGQYTKEQAASWIASHIELAADSIALRDHFAGLAMQALIAEPTSASQSTVQYLTEAQPGDAERKGARLARAAYVMADAMWEARVG